MQKGNYNKYMMTYIDKQNAGFPIFSSVAAENVADVFCIDMKTARSVVNLSLKRLCDNGVIKRYERGIYYKSKETLFGSITVNSDAVGMQKLLKQGGSTIGYEAGPSLFNRIGLSSQVPKNYFITTNLYKKKLRDSCNITIQKPVIKITDENANYLQALDAIENLRKLPVNTDCPITLLREFLAANNIESKQLISMAAMYYGGKVLTDTVNIASVLIEPQNQELEMNGME